MLHEFLQPIKEHERKTFFTDRVLCLLELPRALYPRLQHVSKLHNARLLQLEFLSEAETMKAFDHNNIVKLLGVCTKGEPAFAVMELMIHGMKHKSI